MTPLFNHSVTVFLASAFLSFGLGLPTARILRHLKVIDWPNSRSSHREPTIRGGGIAIVGAVGIVASILIFQTGNRVLLQLCTAAAALSIVSFYDDLKSVSAVTRFGCQALAAIVVLFALDWPSVVIRPWPGRDLALAPGLGLFLLFLWIVGHTNAFNFMDGINGLAAGQAIITCGGMALLLGLTSGNFHGVPVLFCVAISGAALGFLPYNFPRARMFMGDVSSAPLGFLVAALVCWIGLADRGRLLIPVLLLHANFILDTGITLARRIIRGERWYGAHREHFYQRLVASGMSHTFVTGMEMILQSIVLFLMLAYVSAAGPTRLGLIVLVILIWGGFFAYCESRYRRSARQSKPQAQAEASLMASSS